MNQQRLHFLRALALTGQANDHRVMQRHEKLLNITPDTGPFLALLLKATRARSVLEIGTSNGYSTIWLADAVQSAGGRVTTVEADAAKAALARANFQQADVASWVTVVEARAENWLPTCADTYDFVFLDADRTQYAALWPGLLRLLGPGGLVVVDNAVSHHSELLDFTALVQATPGVESVVVPIGNGELLIWKEALIPPTTARSGG